VKQATVHDKAVKQRTFSLPFLITVIEEECQQQRETCFFIFYLKKQQIAERVMEYVY
jgi:hypothetical protein